MAGITETKNRLPNEFVNNLYEMFTPGMVDNIFRGIAEKRLTTLRVNTLKYDIQSLMKYFKEINIKNTVINKIGSLTLGIYLIHDHVYVRNFIYDALNYSNNIDNSFIPYTLIIVITIFIGCAIIEYLRQFLFNAVKQYRIKLKLKSKVSY